MSKPAAKPLSVSNNTACCVPLHGRDAMDMLCAVLGVPRTVLSNPSRRNKLKTDAVMRVKRSPTK
jgi:hypothetical protein